MMNLDSLFLRKGTPEARVKRPTPEKGAARFSFLAYTHFAKLVGLNLLFLLFCIPVVTIPAALSGLSRVNMLLTREGTAGVWRDFSGEFKSSFLRSIPLGALIAFLLADAALCVWLSMHSGSVGMAVALLAAALIITIFGVLLSCYTFVLLSIVSLRNRDILRDAVLLILLQPKTDLLLLLIIGGGAAAAAWLLPYSIPVVSVIWPALLSLAACTIINGPIERLITHNS